MRTYWRQRNDLVRAGARHIQRVQKALTQMNIQLANVLSDVSGMTGQLIIKAILAGERDPVWSKNSNELKWHNLQRSCGEGKARKKKGKIHGRERLGDLLKYYQREAA